MIGTNQPIEDTIMKIRQVIFVFVYTLLQSLNQANCYYNFDGISNAVRYLNDYTPTPVKNIFLVTSSFLTSEYEFFIEDIHHVIKTIENPKYRVTFITNTKGNISAHMCEPLGEHVVCLDHCGAICAGPQHPEGAGMAWAP